MSDPQYVAVQMDNDNNLIETPSNRLTSSDRTSIDSPGPRRRSARTVSEADEDDQTDILEPSATGVDDDLLPAAAATPAEEKNNAPRVFAVSKTGGRKTIMVDGIETQVPDINAYQHKKIVAQGMMDLALLTANTNQLRYVWSLWDKHPFFYPSLIFISLSIILQVAVGIGLILSHQYNIKDDFEIYKANRISNMTTFGILLITIVNVFITSFGVADVK